MLQQAVGCTRLYADRIYGDTTAMQAIIKVLHEHWPIPLRAHRLC